jgi:hypothetical protein
MSMQRGDDAAKMEEAMLVEGEAHRLLLAGDDEDARARLREAVSLYRSSWELAPPRAFGRLIGMLKAAVLVGDATDAALYVRGEIGGVADSPPSAYALAIAALVLGDDAEARRFTAGMRAGSPAFGRAADAIDALASRNEAAYAAAVGAIVADFEGREEHLTGVRIADTALMLERLAEPRGMASRPVSAVMP